LYLKNFLHKVYKNLNLFAEMTNEFNSAIWTEKYRPVDFGEILGHDEIIARVKALIEAKNLPHMLFAGPAGSGKTTLALIMAKKLFGSTWRENFLELNASDTRGIDVVRQQVKSFARTKALGQVPFKIILLDESDALTKEAQHALRRIMEMYTGTCRFILSCNASSKIIDPIQSRCAVFRFRLLERQDVDKIVKKIAKEEKLSIDDKAFESIYNLSKGDVRRVINVLQASSSITKNITEKTINETAAMAEPAAIKAVLELAVAGKFLESRDRLLDMMLKQGLGGLDIIKAIQREIWGLNVSQEKKIRFIERCGEIEFRLVEGSDEFIQLEALLASFLEKN
jgi:replication factor C small subunit